MISKTGVEIMSMNVLLDNDCDPVIWRGPVIAGTVLQFWTDVIWNDVDYMFVDMPPGTGDVPLSVYQSLPLDGIVVVTTPQELVSMIVKKAVNMAEKMNIPVLGIVENMSYVKCPDCGKVIEIFGKSRADALAKELGVMKTSLRSLSTTRSRRAATGGLSNCSKAIIFSRFSKNWKRASANKSLGNPRGERALMAFGR